MASERSTDVQAFIGELDGGVRDCGDRNHGADVYSLDYRGTSELALE